MASQNQMELECGAGVCGVPLDPLYDALQVFQIVTVPFRRGIEPSSPQGVLLTAVPASCE